ncbi:MAG: hypothetical protein GXY89_00305 [Tissierellia bacterium]|jgi:hypothetical protein|nr:hypothetical protein [Tissierellia bacterium]
MELIILFSIAFYIIIKTSFLANITGKSRKTIEKRIYILSIIGIAIWIYLGWKFFYNASRNWDLIQANMELKIIYPFFTQLNNLFLKLYESENKNAAKIAILTDYYLNYLLSFILLYFSIWNLNRKS